MVIPYICCSCRRYLAQSLKRTKEQHWYAKAGYSLITPWNSSQYGDPLPTAHDQSSANSPENPQHEVPDMLDDLYTHLSVSNLPRNGHYSGNIKRSDKRDSIHKGPIAGWRRDISSKQPKFRRHRMSSDLKMTSKLSGEFSAIARKKASASSNFQHLRSSKVQPPEKVITEIENYDSIVKNIRHQISGRNLKSAPEVWRFFLDAYPNRNCKNLRSPTLRDIPSINDGRIFSDLLKFFVKQWIENNKPLGPSPSEVISKYEELGVLRPSFWSDALFPLANHLLLVEQGIDPAKTEKDLIPRIVPALMLVWKNCLEMYIGSSASKPRHIIDQPRLKGRELVDPENPNDLPAKDIDLQSPGIEDQTDWSFLPNQRALADVAKGGTRLDFGSRFFQYLLRYRARRDFRLSTAALITFCSLSRLFNNERLSKEFQIYLTPFTTFIAHLLPYSDLKYEAERIKVVMSKSANKVSEIKPILNTLDDAHAIALAEIGSKTRPDYRDLPYLKTISKAQKNLEAFFMKRLQRCLWNKSAEQLDALWAEAQQTFDGDFSYNSPRSSQIPIKVYNEFLVIYHTLKMPHKAVAVWEYMVSHGISPTVVTWTSMMKGCQVNKNWEGSERIWQTMLANGIQPDAQAWAVRLYNIFHSKQIQQAMKALAQMTDEWQAGQAKVDQRGGCKNALSPKPNVEVLNAALSGITKFRRTTLVPKILSWAKELQVPFDAVTYNILIRSALEEDNEDEAQEILRKMNAEGIEPDNALFSILLNSMFKNSAELQSLSDDALTERILSIVSQLGSHAIRSNSYPYTILVAGLIHYRQNPAAAQLVLDHMAQHNVRPSPHIYTSLVNHYFSQDPPDEGAINAIWEQAQSQGLADAVLYDRMIENYAQNGEVGKMMFFLQKMHRSSKTPSWRALGEVIRALARAGHWDRFDEVAEDVRDGEIGIRDDGREENGKESFWEEVRRLRLYRESR